MEQHSLSEQQYEQLVDYLHRWGLDSPELIAEMADHFSEKALELMAQGYSWERVLSSFKTKKVYLELRRAQVAYTAVVEKSVWRVLLHQMGAALHPKYLLLLGLTGLLSYYLLASAYTEPAFKYLMAFKNLLVLVLIAFVIHFHKDMKRLAKEKYAAFGCLYIMDYATFIIYSDKVFWNNGHQGDLSAGEGPLLFIAITIVLSVYCNVVAWRLFQIMRAHVSNTHPSIRKVLKEV